MLILKFIWRACRGMVLLTTFTALLSGACNAGVVAMVTKAITDNGSTKVLLWGFIALGVGKLATTWLSQVMLANFAQGAVSQLRRDLISKLISVPLRDLEEIGSARILVALTDDVFNLT